MHIFRYTRDEWRRILSDEIDSLIDEFDLNDRNLHFWDMLVEYFTIE